MDAEQLRAEHAAVVAEHGIWTGHNLHLGHGVWTMGSPAVGAAEANAERLLQHVAALVRRPLAELRVLDLGAMEGLYAVTFARAGAEVHAIEGREASAAKIRFAADVLGLGRLTAETADARTLSPERHGTFDVVLCLGLLYHLPAEDLRPFLRALRAVSRHVAVVETQVALTADREADGLRGRDFPEPHTPWAALDGRTAFWLTRPSLLNALLDAGFASAGELLAPPVEGLLAYRDHVVLTALVPADGAAPPPAARWPERHRPLAHPSQAWRHAWREKLRERRTPLLALYEKRRRAG